MIRQRENVELFLRNSVLSTSALKMESMCLCETLAYIDESVWRQDLKQQHHDSYRSENLSSQEYEIPLETQIDWNSKYYRHTLIPSSTVSYELVQFCGVFTSVPAGFCTVLTDRVIIFIPRGVQRISLCRSLQLPGSLHATHASMGVVEPLQAFFGKTH